MKLQFLQTLQTVVDSGSFAAAAPKVHLTASGVGLQIRQLEEYFGQPLFDRSARNVRPTAFALELAQTVRQTMDTLQQFRARRQAAVTGHVRLGTIESAQVSLLPVALRDLRTKAPALEVQFVRGTSVQLLDQLKAGTLDAAVVIRPPSGGSSRLHWVRLTKEAFVLVAPPKSREKTPIELLRAHEWIRLDRSTTGGQIASRYVEKLAPRIRSSVEIPGTEAIVALVSAGLGVSVIPKLRAGLVKAHPVREISLGASAPSREIAYVSRAAGAGEPRLAAVLASFQLAAQRRSDDAD